MWIRPPSWLVLSLCALWSAGLPALGGEHDVEALLREGAQVRSSSSHRLGEIVEALQAMPLSQRQAQQADLLRAYHVAINGGTAPALEILTRLVEVAHGPLRFEAGGLLANVYAVARDFENALRTLDDILPLQVEIEDAALRHRILLSAGVVYNQVGEFELGEHFARQVLSDGPDSRSRCVGQNLVLESRVGQQQPVEDVFGRDAIRTCDLENERVLAGFSRVYFARVLDRTDRTREAMTLLEEYLEVIERIPYPLIRGQFHAALAEYRLKLGDDAAAQSHAEIAVEHVVSMVSAEPLVTAYRVLHTLADRAGDDARTLAVYRDFVAADRALFNDMKSREMAFQIVRHQSQQQAQQIELLAQKNALLELEQTTTRQRARLWLAMALLLSFLLATTAYWAFKTKRLQMHLRRLADTDALTGLSNRGHFSLHAQSILDERRRAGGQVTLVMLDLDHFKQINDRFGHAAGDWVLFEVAQACREGSPAGSCVARLGGEEFAILLPGADAVAGHRLAEALLRCLGEIDTASKGYEVRLSASFGVADTDHAGYDLSCLLSHADHAMYAAKAAGRGQVRTVGEAAAVAAVDPLLDLLVQTSVAQQTPNDRQVLVT